MSPLPDTTLLTAWRTRRDEAAYRALCERYAGLVEATCRRLGSPEPDEATQAVFIAVAQRTEAQENIDCFAGWLMGATRQVVSRQRRSLARRRRYEQAAGQEIQRARQVERSGSTWEDVRPLLDDALAELSPGRREAVIQFYLNGKSQATIADELGCSVDAVKTRVHEGISILREFFAQRGVTLGIAAVSAGLAGEAASAEPALVDVCVKAGLAPQSAPAATTLAKAATSAQTISNGVLVGVGFVLAGLLMLVAWFAVPPSSSPSAEPAAPVTAAPIADTTPTPASQHSPADMLVSPNSRWAPGEFDDIHTRGGPIIVYRDMHASNQFLSHNQFIVPVELLHAPVTVRRFVAAVASTAKLEAHWLHGDTVVMLQRPTNATERDRVLVELLSPDPVKRAHATWQSGWIRDLRMIDPLLVAMTDPEPQVRTEAARSLSRLGFDMVGYYAGDRAAPVLETLLNHLDPVVRRSAALGLQGLPGDAAVRLLTTALADPDAEVRRNALSFVRTGDGMRIRSLLEQHLADQDPGVRAQAIWSLLYIARDTALAQAKTALADPDPQVRARVAARLLMLPGKPAQDLLTVAVHDLDSAVRREAAFALGIMDQEHVFALHAQAYANHDIAAVEGFTLALAMTQHPQLLSVIKQMFGNQQSEMRKLAVDSLSYRSGDEQVVALLASALADQDRTVRLAAVFVLGIHGGPQAVALLETALTDSDFGVRNYAFVGLAHVDSQEHVVALVSGLFADPNSDANIREAAIGAFGNGIDIAGPWFFPLLQTACVDPNPVVRKLAFDALACHGEYGGDQAVTLAIRGLADYVSSVRQKAVDALGRLGGEQARLALIKQLTEEKHPFIRRRMVEVLRSKFTGDPGVDVALKSLEPGTPEPPRASVDGF